jgi:hypothetical protein
MEIGLSPHECFGSGESANRYRADLGIGAQVSRPEVIIEIKVIGGHKVPRGVVVAGL